MKVKLAIPAIAALLLAGVVHADGNSVEVTIPTTPISGLVQDYTVSLSFAWNTTNDTISDVNFSLAGAPVQFTVVPSLTSASFQDGNLFLLNLYSHGGYLFEIDTENYGAPPIGASPIPPLAGTYWVPLDLECPGEPPTYAMLIAGIVALIALSRTRSMGTVARIRTAGRPLRFGREAGTRGQAWSCREGVEEVNHDRGKRTPRVHREKFPPGVTGGLRSEPVTQPCNRFSQRIG